MKKKIQLMFDSGAFSAWRKNDTICVDEYSSFILAHKHFFHSYVALDVIPGVIGSIGTPKTIERSAKLTSKNLKVMRSKGLDPIGVYHMGERRYWLEKLIKEGTQYIGLGGLARVPEEMRRPWLNSVFEYLCGEGGYPEIKVHGFGVTSIETVHMYPWTTVDSVSWRLHGAYGWAIVPSLSQNKHLPLPPHMQLENQDEKEYDYRSTPLQIYLSKGNGEGSEHKAARTHQHIGKMGGSMNQYVRDYLLYQGFDIDEVMVNPTARTNVSLRFYKTSAAAFEYQPFVKKESSLFNLLGAGQTCVGSRDHPKKMIMFYGTSPSKGLIGSLRSEGILHILLSYIYFRNKKTPPLDLERFVMRGDIGKA